MENLFDPNGEVFYRDLPGFISALPELTTEDFHKHGRWDSYANIPASFDIETTSTYISGQKVAFMYVWQLGICGRILLGRTWDEFTDALVEIAPALHLAEGHRKLIIYVHNLSFEFQFMKDRFEWDKIFALKKRKVLYAICDPYEFRCSYLLTNYHLAYLGKKLLHKYPVQKLVGDLDYSLIRHSDTELTTTEIGYCINDVRVVMSYIQEQIENLGGIENIPLTNTGHVRKHCREICLSSKRFKYLIRNLVINSLEEYDTLKRAFMGGFVHANAYHVCKNLSNVGKIDLASDYPARCVLEYFPMSSSTYYPVVDYGELQHLLDTKCCIFDLCIHNIEPAVPWDNIISVSRVTFLEDQDDYVQNNGRLVSCDGWIQTTCTEIDFEYYQKFYTWDDMEIRNLYTYERGYLPTELVKSILDFYKKKTSLKDIPERFTEYMVSKNMINSSYGMMVTDILRDDVTYSSAWLTMKPDDSKLDKYNNNHKRFLFYPWGIYVTAHARAQIYSAILEFKNDYVYSDTDSVMAINYLKHKQWVADYNSKIISKIVSSSIYHHLPLDYYMPVDTFGRTHPIGVFEYEGQHETFRTCGAKRYIEYDGDDFVITVAGLGKQPGHDYLLKTFKTKKNILEHFREGLTVPAGSTGKLTHTYIDERRTGVITDFQGKIGFYDEFSGTHLEPAPFSMSMLDSYLDYLFGIDELIYTE